MLSDFLYDAKADIKGSTIYPAIIENNRYAYMNVLIGKFQIKDIIGKAIIVHDMPDDFTTQPSGNSGKKIACGIIK